MLLSSQNTTSAPQSASYYRLNDLPLNKETFISREKNNLQKGSIDLNGYAFSLTLPKLSVTAVQMPFESYHGIKQIKETKLRLYPNPAKEQVMIETSGLNGSMIVNINDLTGKTVKTFHIENCNKKTPIDLTGVGKGFYIVSVLNNNQNFTQKMIVE
jgi:hypothetical protein